MKTGFRIPKLSATAALLMLSFSALASPRSDEAVRESVLRLAAGDVPGAYEQARVAAAADQSSSKAFQQLARAAGAALDFPAAEAAASRAMELSGPTPALLCLRSEAHAGRGDFEGALADAQKAAAINPGSAQAVLRRALAKEGLGRPAEEVLADYLRAAELDVSHAALRDAAILRLAPPRRSSGGMGVLLGILAVSGLVGWAWGRWSGGSSEPEDLVASVAPRLPGTGLLAPREALRALSSVAASYPGPEGAFALAADLRERLTGRREAPKLPVGMEAFFERALNPDPQRRFRSGIELLGAFRSLVDPAVD